MGYSIEFEPERLEVFQDDEANNASALGTLASSIANTPPDVIELSMSILGYELTEDQQAMLDELKTKREEETTTDTEVEVEPVAKSYEDDLAKWMRKACKHIGKDVDFMSADIPSVVATYIHAKLPDCKCADEVRALFETPEAIDVTTDFKAIGFVPDYSPILDAMRLEVSAIKATPIITQAPAAIQADGVTFDMPEQPAPQVTVNMDTKQIAEIISERMGETLKNAIAAIPVPQVNFQPPPIIANIPDESLDVVKAIRKLVKK
jgi:hypothetical protein